MEDICIGSQWWTWTRIYRMDEVVVEILQDHLTNNLLQYGTHITNCCVDTGLGPAPSTFVVRYYRALSLRQWS